MKAAFILVILFCFACPLVLAQTVHSVLVCNTTDRKIGTSSKVNYESISFQAKIIAKGLGYNYSEKTLKGRRDFKADKLDQLLALLAPAQDDIVIFYFSTHGGMTPDDSNEFPQIKIPTRMISSFNKHREIEHKGPQLLITLVEACSGFIPISEQDAFVLEQTSGKPIKERKNNVVLPDLSTMQVNNIRKLFLDSARIIMAAGTPGENTWATNRGSIFTNCFIRTLGEFLVRPSVDWNGFIKQCRDYTEFTSAILTNGKTVHHPIARYYRPMTAEAPVEPAIKPRVDAVKYAKGRPDRPMIFMDTSIDIINNSALQLATTNQPLVSDSIPRDQLPAMETPYDTVISRIDGSDLLRMFCKRRSGVLSSKYNINFEVNETRIDLQSVDSVQYFLHHTFENPIVTRYDDSNNYQIQLTRVWGEFLMKAKIFYKNGVTEDIYRRIELEGCNSSDYKFVSVALKNDG